MKALSRRAARHVIAAVLLLSAGRSAAQLQIAVSTPSPSTDPSQPNSYIGLTSSQYAVSLLGDGLPAFVWGSVPSSSVGDVCNTIVDTGSHSIDTVISGDNWGNSPTSYEMTFQLVATGGCNSAADNVGTQFVFTDPTGRKVAIVCADDAGVNGCPIFWTGDDVAAAYSGSSRRRLASATGPHRHMLSTCTTAVAVSGAVATVSLAATGVGAVLSGIVAGAFSIGGSFCDDGCFPGDAKVLLSNMQLRSMSELAIGDQVAARSATGQLVYDTIYAFGHHSSTASGHFLKLTTVPFEGVSAPAHISVTRDHFVVTAAGMHKRARDVRLNETLLVMSEGSVLLPHVITGITHRYAKGLFNPLTLSGTIIVDGTLASVHSEWFLDPYFDRMGVPNLLPHVYQAILAPARMLYHLLGKNVYLQLYAFIDNHIDIAEAGTAYGGHMAIAASVTSLALAGLIAPKLAKHT